MDGLGPWQLALGLVCLTAVGILVMALWMTRGMR